MAGAPLPVNQKGSPDLITAFESRGTPDVGGNGRGHQYRRQSIARVRWQRVTRLPGDQPEYDQAAEHKGQRYGQTSRSYQVDGERWFRSVDEYKNIEIDDVGSLLSQRQMYQVVAKFIGCHACETEFGVRDDPPDRCALRHEQDSVKAAVLPLPPRCDLKEVSVLRQQDPPKRCRPSQ